MYYICIIYRLCIIYNRFTNCITFITSSMSREIHTGREISQEIKNKTRHHFSTFSAPLIFTRSSRDLHLWKSPYMLPVIKRLKGPSNCSCWWTRESVFRGCVSRASRKLLIPISKAKFLFEEWKQLRYSDYRIYILEMNSLFSQIMYSFEILSREWCNIRERMAASSLSLLNFRDPLIVTLHRKQYWLICTYYIYIICDILFIFFIYYKLHLF